MAGSTPAQQEATETTPLVRAGGRSSRLSVVDILSGRVEAKSTDATVRGQVDDDDDPPEAPAADAQAGDLAIVSGAGVEGRQSNSIFKQQVDEAVEKADPGMKRWLDSISGSLFQAAICLSLVVVSQYEVILKKRAGPSVTSQGLNFDPASLGIGMSIFSLLFGTALAAGMGQLELLFNWGTPKKLVLYALPGCCFCLTSYLQVVIYGFLPADVFKVLEQARLLVTAVLSMLVLKQKQSMAGWNSLVVITLAAMAYGEIRMLEEEVRLAGKGANKATQAKAEASSYAVGVAITGVYIFLQAGAGIACESVFKQEKHLPFYIQKVFLEVPGLLFGLFLSGVGNGWVKAGLVAYGNYIDVKFNTKSLEGNLFTTSFSDHVKIWTTGFMLAAFVFFVGKSWVSGFLVKQLSSLVKQLCSVTSAGLLYFSVKIHNECPTRADFFCPSNLRNVTRPMVIVNFCVLCAVVAFALARRDKAKKQQYKQDAAKALPQEAAKEPPQDAAKAAEAKV